MLKTPLHPVHVELDARLVPFGGWDMPVMYKDITSEHLAVRERAGMFDISHMGRVRLQGKDADKLAARVFTLDTEPLALHRTRYALICNEAGGIEDDVLISRENGGLLVVVNAGNRQADVATLRKHAEGLDVEVKDDSDAQSMIAIQGPKSVHVLKALNIPDVGKLKYYRLSEVEESPFGPLVVSRTGYTGERGYEVMMAADQAVPFWRAALKAGEEFGLTPCGLGARDTLRLEAGMPLHGHEIGPEINAYEADISFAVRSDHPYTGSKALAKVEAEGPKRRLIGLFVDGPRIPREGQDVLIGETKVGYVCSGTHSPTLSRNIATALVSAEHADAESFTVAIRKHNAEAKPTALPFYSRTKGS